MSYRRKKPRRVESGTFLVNITSMTDMFTMLLVFLLQTYATSDLSIQAEAGLKLPVSSSLKNPSKAPQVIITGKEVKLDGQVVMSLVSGRPSQTDRDPQNPQILRPLYEALKAKLPADGSQDSVVLQADSSNDMASLNTYFTTISAAGFAKVKLATLVGR